MGGGAVWYSLLFILPLLLNPDSSFSKRPPTKAILVNKARHVQQDQDQKFSSSPTFTARLDDDIPIVQPTTPIGTPNTDSPTQFPPTTTTPTGNPTSLQPPSGFPPNNPSPFPSGPSGPMTPSVPIGPMNPSGQTGPSGPSSSGGSWCVASSSASETALQVALDYACGYGGADCSEIQPGAGCYNPNTVRDHASYAFNAYYQKNPAPTSCSFGGVAQVTNTEPSSGGCHYTAAKSTGTTPPTPPMLSAPSIPTLSTPINPYPTSPSVPGGYTDPGYTSSEPTGEPSSGDFVVANLLLPLTITSLLMLLNRVLK